MNLLIITSDKITAKNVFTPEKSSKTVGCILAGKTRIEIMCEQDVTNPEMRGRRYDQVLLPEKLKGSPRRFEEVLNVISPSVLHQKERITFYNDADTY